MALVILDLDGVGIVLRFGTARRATKHSANLFAKTHVGEKYPRSLLFPVCTIKLLDRFV